MAKEKEKKVTKKADKKPVAAVSTPPHDPKKDINLPYYLTIFRVEGNTRYRAAIGPRKEVHSEKPILITDQKWYRIDKITGEITEEKS